MKSVKYGVSVSDRKVDEKRKNSKERIEVKGVKNEYDSKERRN